MKTIMEKLMARFADVISSDRFWYNIGLGILVALQQNDWKKGAITALMGILVVGSVDSAAKKVGGQA